MKKIEELRSVDYYHRELMSRPIVIGNVRNITEMWLAKLSKTLAVLALGGGAVKQVSPDFFING